MKNAKPIVTLLALMISISMLGKPPRKNGYYFDKNGISKDVLQNYLDRSVTMAFFLVPLKPEGNRTYPYHEDDIRLIKNIGAKFIGRSIYRWGGESRLNEPEFWNTAKNLIDTIHAFDPEVIFQGCLFEMISPDVNKVATNALTVDLRNITVRRRYP
jgi:hypothetical protein